MAGFVKLDRGILLSTVWTDIHQRNVFLTCLLMAEPHELTEPAAQLHVDSLEETGWVVPPGRYGFIGAAGPGIVRLSGVGEPEGTKALRALGQPDLDSRSQEHEGRRVVRVNGGYIVLNYMKYRDYDYTAAERARRYRRLKKQREGSRRDRHDDRRDVTVDRPNVTKNGQEAESREQRGTASVASQPAAPPVSPQSNTARQHRKAGLQATYDTLLGESTDVKRETPPVEGPTDGELMGAVRRVLYVPDGIEPPGWQAGRDITILRALRRGGLTGQDILAAIEGLGILREAGELTWLAPGEKATMRALYHTEHGPLPLFRSAQVAFYRADNSRTRPRRVKARTKPLLEGDVERRRPPDTDASGPESVADSLRRMGYST